MSIDLAAVTAINTHMHIGADYPLLTPDRWMKDFGALDIKDDARALILKDNAIRALELDPA